MAGANVNWKTFGQVISENLGQGEKPDYFTAKATIMLAKKDNCMYTVRVITQGYAIGGKLPKVLMFADWLEFLVCLGLFCSLADAWQY